jgi:hypothetical protein
MPQQSSIAVSSTSTNPLLQPMSSTTSVTTLDPYGAMAANPVINTLPLQQPSTIPIMNNTVDRFAALDVLGSSNNNSFGTNNPMKQNHHSMSNKSFSPVSNAFSDLVGPLTSTSAPATTTTTYDSRNPSNLETNSNYYGFATVPVSPSPSMPAVVLSSIQVSQPPPAYGFTTDGSERNDDSGFVMGGSTGAGLVPTGHAPASAPPPPPPSSFY